MFVVAVKTKNFFLFQRSHLSEETQMNIFLKKDYMQYTGSFKERGARYTLVMMSDEEKKRGVISASAGNHALGLAYHGQQLGTIFDDNATTIFN